MKKLFDGSLQVKIMGLVISLVLFVIVSLLAIFIYFDAKQTFENTKDLSLQTAKTISFMPTVRASLRSPDATKDFQLISKQILSNVDANFIVIEDREGKILWHTDRAKIGTVQPIKDNYKAIVYGGYYNLKSTEHRRPAIVGKAPILHDQGKIIGVVTVGYLMEDVYRSIISRLKGVLYLSIIIILLGIVGSIVLARDIRKDTLGLEPRQIASLYRDRDAIISSVSEGIIAMDNKGNITLINRAAETILGITQNYVKKPIHLAIPNLGVLKMLKNKRSVSSFELKLKEKVLIMNAVPIMEGEAEMGAVLSFRDKTEMLDIINTLSEVKEYSEDLRAQTHEFTNKLYIISGLLQLGHYDEAIEMLQSEIDLHELNNRLVFEQIKDPKVQALILGKIGKASEKKVKFFVDENSSLDLLPEHIKTTELSVIIGNIVDNAIEEAGIQNTEKQVSFFALDIGNDIIFEVTDNGRGIPEVSIDAIFELGYSTKNAKGRGYGLYNVKKVVKELNGTIEVSSNQAGTTFTVYLPKSWNREE